MDDHVEHNVSYLVQRGWARIGSLTRTYIDFAFGFYTQHCAASLARLPRPPRDTDPTDYYERENAYRETAIKAVVFAGLAVEAGIYELAASHLGDKFTKDYVERMDVGAKWMLVPRLICGSSLDEGGPGMNLLNELIQVRNLLVHHKSLAMPALNSVEDGLDDDDFSIDMDDSSAQALLATLKRASAQEARIVECAEKSVQAIVCLSLELDDLLGVPSVALGHYGAGTIRLGEDYPASVRSLIATCRKKVADRRVKRTSAA
jgi:hypothetical protein